MEVSSCLIVKNGGHHFINLINQLLEFSSEIIIVDTGSDKDNFDLYNQIIDNRLKIYEFDWVDDFSKARNYSFSKATKDWIFWCDADDSLTSNLIDVIKNLSIPDGYNDVLINYEFCEGYFVPRSRLLRRASVPIWYERVHEYVVCQVEGARFDLSDISNGYIKHDHRTGSHTDRNIKIYQDMIAKGQQMSGRSMLYYANELFDIGNYHDAFIYYEKSLNLLHGFDIWNALIKMYKINKLHDMDQSYWLDKALILSNKMDMRGDICYLIGVSYLNLNDKEQGKAWLGKALNVEAKGVDAFGEDIYMSKYLPAITLRYVFEKEGAFDQVKIINELIERFIKDYNLDRNKLLTLKSDYNGCS